MSIVYNWHITEHCNYSCNYCFAQWDRPPEAWKDDAQVISILEDLKSNGHLAFNNKIKSPIRLNFAGGEPLLLKGKLLSTIKIANQLGFITSVITNGSLLSEQVNIAKHIDMIGISIDSFNIETNHQIGRCTRSERTLSYRDLATLIEKIREINNNIKIKFNVVVNKLNFQEQLIEKLQQLTPYKIKILKELSAGKNVSSMNGSMFKHFISVNNCNAPNIFIEDNNAMTESYLMIDPQGRLYQNGQDSGYHYSKPIQEVGIKEALNSIKFNSNAFMERYKGTQHG
jgi:radical S-adenosyl methionine domain-containing protein 2